VSYDELLERVAWLEAEIARLERDRYIQANIIRSMQIERWGKARLCTLCQTPHNTNGGKLIEKEETNG